MKMSRFLQKLCNFLKHIPKRLNIDVFIQQFPKKCLKKSIGGKNQRILLKRSKSLNAKIGQKA